MYGVRVRASQHMYAPKNNNGALEMFTIKCITSVARTARCTGNGVLFLSWISFNESSEYPFEQDRVGKGKLLCS
jgi:hypothetical protein